MYSAKDDPKGPGFPIRKSTDQRVLAPPRSLSQRATSFVASVRQGIHQMPLKRLIQRNPSRPGINPQRFATQSVRPVSRFRQKAAKGGSAPAKRQNRKPRTQLIRLRFQDPARAFRYLPQHAQPKPSRPRSQKPLTTQFRSTKSNNKRTAAPQRARRPDFDFQG